jgi:hypothetical protein
MINLAAVIHSPMLSQSITIKRSSGIWEDGEFVRNDDSPETLILQGIVTVASARDLQMVPEGDRQSGAMKVLVSERLYVTGEGDNKSNFSDILVWRGESYRLHSVTPDADYGFYRAIATRILGEVS